MHKYTYVPLCTHIILGWLAQQLTNHSMVCLSKISDGGHDQQLPSLQKTSLSSALGCGNLTWPRNLHFSLENSRKPSMNGDIQRQITLKTLPDQLENLGKRMKSNDCLTIWQHLVWLCMLGKSCNWWHLQIQLGVCTFFAPVTLWKPQTPVHNLNYAEQQQRFKQMRKHPNGAGKETYRR